MSDEVRLNLGAGDVELEGFTAIDRKFGTEAFPLLYEDGTVDEIRASHVLEHFGHMEVSAVVNHWVDKLKPGGRLRVAVPDFLWITEKYLKGEPINTQGYVCGGQTDENDFHRTIFDRETLTEVFIGAGLEHIKLWESEVKDGASLPVSLNLQGTKPTHDIAEVTGVAALLSMPRFGPTMHGACAFNALSPLGIPCQKGIGAYWHQNLSEMMEEYISAGVEYILTLDYDTIFRRDDVLALYRLMQALPEIDALCAVQMRRHMDKALFTIFGDDDMPVASVYTADFDRHATPITTGHFGLTMIRASSLQSMPRPWMLPEPNKAGQWGDGKIDADMMFWKNWRDNGLTVRLANHVIVGHMQEMIAWPGKSFAPVYQDFDSYLREGIPAEVER